MKWHAVIVGAVIALGVHGGASAQVQTCYEWQYSVTIGAQTKSWHKTPMDAAQEYASDYCAHNSATATGCTVINFLVTSSGHPGYSWNLSYTTVPGGTTQFTAQTTSASRQLPGGCPLCPATGSLRSSTFDAIPTMGQEVCGSDGCSYKVASPVRVVLLDGGFGPVATVESAGRACSSTEATANDEQIDNAECVDAGGNIACGDSAAAPGQGCGFFNGDYICTGHVPDDSCVSFASGAVACMAGSSDAPKDAGGTPLPADGSVSSGDVEVDYYSPETVAGATTPATTVPGQGGSAEGAPGRDGSSSTGSGGSSGGGDTIINCDGPDCVELDIEGECPEGETCDGSLPNAGEFGEVCTFGECATAFYNRVKAAPLLSAVTGAGAAMPSGSCPNWTLEAFSEDYSLSAPMCDLWDSVSGVLSAIFLVIWAWVASRMVLSA